MFEPAVEKLKTIFESQGARLDNRLAGLENHLQTLAQDVSSNNAADEYVHYSRVVSPVNEVAEIEFETNEGFAWRVERAAVTCAEKGLVRVYLGDAVPQNLLDVFKEGEEADRPKYYIPPRSRLLFRFTGQGNTQCAVHIQVRRMLVTPEILTPTGRSWEHTDKPHEIPKTPSGHPFRGPGGEPVYDSPEHPYEYTSANGNPPLLP